MFEWLGNLLSISKQVSSLRVGMLLWVIGTFIIWAFLSLKTGTVQAIDMQIATIIGALAAAKATQSFSEAKEYALDKLKKQMNEKNPDEILKLLEQYKNILSDNASQNISDDTPLPVVDPLSDSVVTGKLKSKLKK